MFYADECLQSMYIYIWLSSSSGRGRNINDQLLDLYDYFAWRLLLAHCQYFHRLINIVQVRHPKLSTENKIQTKSNVNLALSLEKQWRANNRNNVIGLTITVLSFEIVVGQIWSRWNIVGEICVDDFKAIPFFFVFFKENNAVQVENPSGLSVVLNKTSRWIPRV